MKTQEEHASAIRRLGYALGRLDVRVVAIAVGMSAVVVITKCVFLK